MNGNKKITTFRRLKTLFYLAGFPLFVLLVLIDSFNMQGSDVFGINAWYGVFGALAVWALALIAQMVINVFIKHGEARTMALVAFVTIIMLVGAVTIDSIFSKKIDAIIATAEAEEEKGHYTIDVMNYKRQTGYYNARTKSRDSSTITLKEDVYDFCTVYNLSYEGIKKGRNLGDYQLTDEDGNLLTDDNGAAVFKYAAEKPDYSEGYYGYAVYSPNGLLADGYVFSVDVALKILIDYNEAIYKYGDDLDAEYAAAVQRAKDSDEYQDYIDSDEYAEYTELLSRNNLTREHLDGIIGALGGSLQAELGGVLSALGSMLSPEISQAINDNVNGDLTLAKLQEVLYSFLLTDATDVAGSITELATTFGVTPAKDTAEYATIPDFLVEVLNGLLGDLLGVTIPAADATHTYADLGDIVLALLQELVGYTSPYITPIYDFFEEGDADLAAYGRALHEGKVHGSLMGSCLIGNKLGAGDYNASFAYTLDELYQLQTDLSYMCIAFPFMSLSRYLYMCAGIVAICLILSASYARKEQELLKEGE